MSRRSATGATDGEGQNAQGFPIPGKWYVMDRFARTMADAYVAGPFDTRADSEADRRTRNIGDDCENWRAPGDPSPAGESPPSANDLQGACIYCGSSDATGHEDGGCPNMGADPSPGQNHGLFDSDAQAAYLADQEEADRRAGGSPTPGGILDTSRRIATEAAPACECSDEYGPCESHGELLAQREGASLRTADELAMVLIEDLIGCGAELSAWGHTEYPRLNFALETSRDPVSGCAWFDDEADGESARDLAAQLESYVADLYVIHDDGYRIVRPSPDCPLLSDSPAIGENRAREIAADWHSGQASGLYAFSSSGYVSVDALSEVETEERRVMADGRGTSADLRALATYLRASGAEDVCPNCSGDGTVIGYGPHDTCGACQGGGFARTL